eukprot:CAMPEP_0173327556 /NCGR_PEP_ID=MMETSP1144-20121109/1672_1 /TAXON_ID=483371 /ORGANISM="non described non described, Strain CCMP2298" /LENGTH=102 /DNA_ID=CAMNT_0014271961 /DNA_START=775 /DNA_END=1083 /DNA_ORIENTATION=+
MYRAPPRELQVALLKHVPWPVTLLEWNVLSENMSWAEDGEGPKSVFSSMYSAPPARSAWFALKLHRVRSRSLAPMKLIAPPVPARSEGADVTLLPWKEQLVR